MIREVNVESTVNVKQQESIMDEGAIEGKLKIQCAPHADDIQVAYLSFKEVINYLMQKQLCESTDRDITTNHRP